MRRWRSVVESLIRSYSHAGAIVPNSKANSVVLGRDLTGDWGTASRREWLVTNNLGGFAAGTVAGANTRRYHGLLVASLKPPVARTVLLAKVDLSVRYQDRSYELGANEFGGGVIHPQGYVHIESFRMLDAIPTWRYAIGDALLEQQIFMAPLTHTSYLGLRLLRASASVDVTLQPLCTYRDYHSQLRGANAFLVDAAQAGCAVRAFDRARVLCLSIDQGSFEPGSDWYWNFFHRLESERGLDASEDLFLPGGFATRVGAGEPPVFGRHQQKGSDGSRVGGSGCAGPHGRAADRVLAGRHAGVGATAGTRIRSVHGPARSSASARDQRHRRLSLVHRLGSRRDDRATGNHDHTRASRCRARGARDLRALRRSRHAAQSLSGRRRAARVQHRRCHAMAVSRARGISGQQARLPLAAPAAAHPARYHRGPHRGHALWHWRRPR